MTKLIALPILEMSTFAVVSLACALAVVPGADELVLGWITRLNRSAVELSQSAFIVAEPQPAMNSSVGMRLAEKDQLAAQHAAPSALTPSEFTSGQTTADFDLDELESDCWEFQDLPAVNVRQEQNQSPIRHQASEADPVFRSLPPSTPDARKNQQAPARHPSSRTMADAGNGEC